MRNLKLVDVSWHRNGISGEGFYAVLFDDPENGRMIASLFDSPGHCAVYSIKELNKGNIAFAMGNSWRGDHYENELRKLIEARESGRLGPFSLIPIESVEKTIAKAKITEKGKEKK